MTVAAKTFKNSHHIHSLSSNDICPLIFTDLKIFAYTEISQNNLIANSLIILSQDGYYPHHYMNTALDEGIYIVHDNKSDRLLYLFMLFDCSAAFETSIIFLRHPQYSAHLTLYSHGFMSSPHLTLSEERYWLNHLYRTCKGGFMILRPISNIRS